MAFRDALSAAGIAALLTGQKIIGATMETAPDGTPRIIIGYLAYNGGKPAISWDLTGAGIDWTEPLIEADPATGQMIILGQQGALAGTSIGLESGASASPAITLDAYSDLGVHVGLAVDSNAGAVVVTGPFNATNFVATPVIKFGTGSPGNIASGVIVVPGIALAAVPYASRVFIQAEGAAGFVAADSTVGLTIGGSHAVTTRTNNACLAQASEFTNVSISGSMDVPAGAASAVNIGSLVGAGTAYFRAALTLIQVPQ
jgi:hypothetical protein